DVVLAVLVVGGWLVLPVPERAEDEGPFDRAVLEGHEHLVIDLGEEVRAALLARHGRGDARPVALVVVGEPGEAELDAAEAVRILVVGDDADDDALDAPLRDLVAQQIIEHVDVHHVAFLLTEKAVLYPRAGAKVWVAEVT